MKYLMLLIALGFALTGCAVSRVPGATYTDQPTAKELSVKESSQVNVLAKADPWRNSGVLVVVGNKYRITADGSWRVHFTCGYTKADGIGSYTGICSSNEDLYPTIIRGAGHAALIAKIGETGKPFVVGNQLEFKADETGPLFFHINEPPLVTYDNDGYMNVATTLLEGSSSVAASGSPFVPSTSVRDAVDTLPSIKTKPNQKNYAIVIGIESYRQKLPKADHATNDAIIMSDYLTKTMGFPEENVITLTNDKAALGDLTKYFDKWLKNNIEKGSTLFIYYSGHGAPNPKNGDAYLVPYDGDPAFIDETGYSLKRLYDNLAKLPAKNIIVALDSCFSGAGGKSVIAKGSRALVRTEKTIAKNILVMTASTDDQVSSSYDDKGHGVFTYFLLKGIKEMLEEDRLAKLEVGELYDYIKSKVEKTSRKLYNNEQTPQLITTDEKMKKINLR